MEMELLVGLRDESGVDHKTAEFVPLDAEKRQELSHRRLLASPGKLITKLLHLCVQRIGEISPLTEAHARQLTSADRSILQIAIRKESIGSVIRGIELVCPSCDLQNVFDYDLDEVKQNPMPVHERGPLGEVIVSFTLSDGREAKLKLATGVEEEEILPLIRVNPEQANMTMLTRCLISIGGEKPKPEDMKNLKLIDEMAEKFLDRQPGPEAAPIVKCEGCSRDVFVEISLVDFLFPSRSLGQRSRRRSRF